MSALLETAGFEPSIYRTVHTPAALSGLVPLKAGEAVDVEAIGLNESVPGPRSGRDSLAIAVGDSVGYGFTGAPYDYIYDHDLSVTRIVDVSTDPVANWLERGDEQIRVNFVSVELDWSNPADPVTIITPLLPGERHEVKDKNGEVVADYGLNEQGGVRVVRHDGDITESDVRLLGLHDHHSAYELRQAVLRKPLPPKTKHKTKLDTPQAPSRIQQTYEKKYVQTRHPSEDRSDDLVNDPGYRVTAKDPITGNTVTYVGMRPATVPVEYVGQRPTYVAEILGQRQDEARRQRDMLASVALGSTTQYRAR